MNGIKIDYNKITNTDPNENIFELRKKIYNKLINKVHQHIDYLYELLANDQKIEDINHRSIKSPINKESLTYLYKGVEIPLMNKTCIILDNIEYIPIFQMVDKPIHLQKDGKYIVVKNNVRNTFLKLDGKICDVLYKNAQIPLLPYLLYIYDNVKEMLIDLGYTVIDNTTNNTDIDLDKDDYYIVPEYYDNTFLIVKKDFELNGWKEYFLSPFTKKRFEFHQQVCNAIIDQINNNIIPEVTEDDENINQMQDIKNSSEIDDQLEEAKKKRENITEKNMREYNLIPHNKNQEILDKIFDIISVYHTHTRTVKRALTKMYLETSLFKFICRDITMDDKSLFDMIIDNIKNNVIIPECYNINDIEQKNIRFMEWYCMKLSSVRSYPESNIIMEVAKTEQKRVYNNSVNPITELSMMSRVNMFGKGALPKESCNATVRNLNDSYMGVIDPIATPSGVNVGISLHLTPEVSSDDLFNEVHKLKNNHIFNKLYQMQQSNEED